ncbi:MAG: ribonuclease D, partial [Actinobacteria bacterium]
MEPVYVTDTAALRALCDRLRRSDVVGIDTEFMRERTYYAKLCLVQVASREEAALIDPLAPGIDLAPLDELLADPDVVKILHAGTQDLEIFFQRTGRVPAPVFDTQVAATLAGYPTQVGYAALVHGALGITLAKGEQFTDWARRPLSDRQLTYAEADARHLPAVHDRLVAALESEGRGGWLADDFARLEDPATYTVVPEEQYRRVKRASASA